MSREVKYWGSEDDEQLSHEDREEYIEDRLGEMDPEEWPDFLEVVGFARVEVTAEFLGGVPLESVLDSLDETFGNPDFGYTEPTEGMKEAERVFLEAVLKDYVPWSCEEVVRESVDLRVWIRGNRPEWMTPEEDPDGKVRDFMGGV